jgi:hypothetical protein
MWVLARQAHWDHEGERSWKCVCVCVCVCVGGRGEGAKHAESVQWQQYSNGVLNFFGLFNIFPTHLPAYYKAGLWIK